MRQFEGEYPDIANKYPKIDLGIINKVNEGIKDMLSKKRDITITNVSNYVDIARRKVVIAVKRLNEFHYIKYRGNSSGKRTIFLTIEEDKNLYFGHDGDEKIIENGILLANKIKNNQEIKKLLGEIRIKKFLTSLKNKDTRKILERYKPAVEILKEKNLKRDIKQMSLNTKAYRITI